MADNRRGGLTNKEALRVFVRKLDDFIENIHSFIPSHKKKTNVFRIFNHVYIVYILIICLSLIVDISLSNDPNRDKAAAIIVPGLLIVLLYFIKVICKIALRKKKITMNIIRLKSEILEEIEKIKSSYFKNQNLEEYEANSYYGYDHCFVQTLRDGSWVRIPKNAIVEGDYIKINYGDKSPADVKCVDYRYRKGDQKWDFCLKKDEFFKGFDDSLSNSHINLYIQNKYDKVFKSKDEWVFEVINDPFLEILEIYVRNYKKKSQDRQQTYQVEKFISKSVELLKYFLFGVTLCLFIVMIYWLTQNRTVKFYFLIMEHPLKFFNFVAFVYIDFINDILLYWAQAIILILKENLIRKPIKPDLNDKRRNSNNYFGMVQNRSYSNENAHLERTTSKTFNEKKISEFELYSFKKHLHYYMKFFQEGIDKSYNLLIESQKLNRLCFLDKDGIIFEKEKDIVELVLFKTNNTIEILNVQTEECKDNIKENEYYVIEDPQIPKEDVITNLKPIALCSKSVRIPLECDRSNSLIFLESNKIKNIKTILPISKINKYSKIFKKKPGYLYSATNDDLKIHFKDCLCLLSRTLGFTDKSLKNYSNEKNFWYTSYLKYENNEYEEEAKEILENLDETEESILYESSDENLITNQIESEVNLLTSSIIKDTILNSYALFTRGSPSSILNLCENYWNGTTIEPIGDELIVKINSLLQQWQSSNIQAIALSYKPTKQNIIEIIDKYNLDLELTDKNILHILKHNSMPQIFLGMIAIKNNLKKSFQDLLDTFNEAGIIFIFFSKEDLNNTKKLGDIFLCEFDFNQCISLLDKDEDNKLPTTENIQGNQDIPQIVIEENRNREGNKYLPTGVTEMREFLIRKDEVPLQVNLFSDACLKDVVEIIELFQEFGEVSGCVTSTLSSENIPALAISNINFGINIQPSYVCNSCNGARKDLQTKSRPTIFETISMKINSIFCSFVIDENSDYSTLTKILSTSRYLMYRIKLNLKFFIDLIYYLIIVQLPSYAVMTNAILDDISIIFIIFIVFPFLIMGALTMKSNSEHIEIMKASKRIKEKLDEQESRIWRHIVKFIFKILIIGSNIALLNAIYFQKLTDLSSYVSENIIIRNSHTNETMRLDKDSFTQFRNFTFLTENLVHNRSSALIYLDLYKNKEINLELFLEDNFVFFNLIFFYQIIWFICSLSLTFMDKFESVFNCHFVRNLKYLMMNLAIIILATAVYMIRFYYEIKDHNNTIEYEYFYIVAYIIVTMLVFVFDYAKKKYNQKTFTDQQKNIKLIIETKLGTYSPK